MLVFLALGDAEVLSFALGDAKVPNARYFAFWWNIGFNHTNYYVFSKENKCKKSNLYSIVNIMYLVTLHLLLADGWKNICKCEA